MAKYKQMPVKGGVRVRNRSSPSITGGGDSTIIKYNYVGSSIQTQATTGSATRARFYIPGQTAGPYSDSATTSPGSKLVKSYSTAVYRPGTKIRWEPSCSFNTSGRVFVAFTDNPEVAYKLNLIRDDAEAGLPGALEAYVLNMRGLSNVRSFPVWQETEIPFPTRTRRKRFDVDATTNILDKADLVTSMQVAMFVVVEGVGTTATRVGSFWYHDVVDVEGIQPDITSTPDLARPDQREPHTAPESAP